MSEKLEVLVTLIDNLSGGMAKMGGSLDALRELAKSQAINQMGRLGSQAFNAMTAAASDFVNVFKEDELIAVRLDAQLAALGSTSSVTAEDIKTLAKQLSDISGFDDDALVQAQTTLLRFGDLSKTQFEQATRAATDLAAMTGVDLATAFQQVGVALDNPEQGFGRLKRVIGDLTDAQKEEIKSALASGDTAKAQGIILDALAEKTNGAAAAVGDTLTGKTDKAKVSIDNLKSSIAGLIGANLPQWVITTGMYLATFGGIIASVLGPLSQLFIIIQGMGGMTAVAAAIGTIFSGISTAIAGLGLSATVALGPVLLLAAALAALPVVIVVYGPEAMHTLSMLGTLAKAVWERMGYEAEEAGKRTRDALDAANKSGRFSFQGIADAAAGLVNQLGMIFGALGARAVEWGRGIANGIKQGLLNAWNDLVTWIKSGMDGILEIIRAYLKISSPSRVFAEQVGKPMAQGIAVGFQSQIGGTGSSMGMSLIPSSRGGSYGGGPITVVYAPAMSLGNRAEFESALVPVLDNALRRHNRGKV